MKTPPVGLSLIKRRLWRPLRKNVLALSASFQERRWLSPRRFDPILEAASELVGQPLERSERRPFRADFSGALLVPVHSKNDPASELLLKLGIDPTFRRRLLAASEQLQALHLRPDLPPQIRRLLPRAHGAKELQSGSIIAVEDLLAGEPLTSACDDRVAFDSLESEAVDLLIDLHRSTRIDVNNIQRATAMENLLSPIQETRAFAPASEKVLRRFAEGFTNYCEESNVPLVLSHGDFHHGNLLVSRDDGVITALLDFDQVSDESFPVLDLYHLLAYRSLLLGGPDVLSADGFKLLLPPGPHADRSLEDRYCRALGLPPNVRPWFSALYLLDAISRRLAPGAAKNVFTSKLVRSYERQFTEMVSRISGS